MDSPKSLFPVGSRAASMRHRVASMTTKTQNKTIYANRIIGKIMTDFAGEGSQHYSDWQAPDFRL